MVEFLYIVFGHNIEAEVQSSFEAKVWSRYCGLRLVNIWSQKFGHDLEAEVRSRF